MSGFIRFIKRQHFWLIIPLLVIIMAVAWLMASNGQVEAFSSRSAAIDGHFSTLSSVQAVNPHPNQAFS